MSNLCVRCVVHCPDRAAARHLAAFIARHSVGDGTVSIPLRLPVKVFSERLTLLERRVVADLYPLHSQSDPHATYSVSLAPKAKGRFLQFAGALALEKGVGAESFGLIVNGHYEVPYGVFGALVDATLGRRIAEASVRDLLLTIAAYMEYASAHDTAARAEQLETISSPPVSSDRRRSTSPVPRTGNGDSGVDRQ